MIVVDGPGNRWHPHEAGRPSPAWNQYGSDAEAVSFGERRQLDRDLLLPVLPETAVIVPALSGKFSKIRNGDYLPQHPLSLMSKDLRLVHCAAKESGPPRRKRSSSVKKRRRKAVALRRIFCVLAQQDDASELKQQSS